VDMTVIALAQQKTRLPYPGLSWRFGLMFSMLSYLVVFWFTLCTCCNLWCNFYPVDDFVNLKPSSF
jgi:hypothetical protein